MNFVKLYHRFALNYGWSVDVSRKLPFDLACALSECITLEDRNERQWEIDLHNAKLKGAGFKNLPIKELERVYSKAQLDEIKKHSQSIKERLKERYGNR